MIAGQQKALLALFLGALTLLSGVQCQTHRRQLLQQDGLLPADFNDRMDAILPTLPFTLSPGSADACEQGAVKKCTAGLTVQTATYGTSRKYPVVLCACKDGSYNVQQLAALFARIPDYLLFFVKSGISVASGGGAAATMFPETGQMTVFGQTRARTLIHESGHAQDRAKGLRNVAYTTTDSWKQAVSKSTCKATRYSATPGVGIGEEYAEDIMIFTYNNYRGSKYPAFETRCLDPELQAIRQYTDSLSAGSG